MFLSPVKEVKGYVAVVLASIRHRHENGKDSNVKLFIAYIVEDTIAMMLKLLVSE